MFVLTEAFSGGNRPRNTIDEFDLYKFDYKFLSVLF